MKNLARLSLTALAAASILSGCKPKDAAAEEKAAADELIRTVLAEPVSSGAVVSEVELVGELEGIEEVRVFSQVPERIRSLAVKEGQAVKKGDVLAIINADLQAEGVNQAQAGLEAALANRDAVVDQLNRTRELARAGSTTASQLQAVEAQARAAEAQVRQASAGLGTAAKHKSNSVVRAPIDGVVAQLTVKVGDMTSPAQPLLTVVRDQRVKGVFRVPEREFFKIQEGQPVALSALADGSKAVQGKVTVKGSVVDRVTRTGLVEVHVDNPDGTLVAGASVRAKIELGRRENLVLVPAEAIMLTTETERTGRAVAFVTDGKVANQRDVKVGARQGGMLEIVEGLKVGESLVVQGAHFLRNGTPVKVVAAAKTAQENG